MAFAAAVLFDLPTFSQIIRYIGGAGFVLMAIITSTGLLGPMKAPATFGAIIVANVLIELAAAYVLLISKDFRIDFAARSAAAPNWLKRVPLVMIVLGLVALATLWNDVANPFRS